MEKELKTVLSSVLDIPIAQINDQLSVHSNPNWDSLKHIDLILSLQKRFGIKFQDEEIPTLINYPMLLITLRSYLE